MDVRERQGVLKQDILTPHANDGDVDLVLRDFADLTGIFGQCTDGNGSGGMAEGQTDRGGELPAEKYHDNFELQRESNKHQTRAASTSNLASNALAATAVAASSSKLASSTIPLALRNMLENALDTLRTVSGSPADRSFAPYGMNFIAGDRGLAIELPPWGDHYRCVTQEDFKDPACLQVGYGGCLPRWVNGSTVYFNICNESFKDPSLAQHVREEALRAIGMWGGIGATFQEVGREEKATFQIKYEDSLPGSTRRVYACSFFPQNTPGTLFVFGLSLETANIDCLANILAHEIGHILGLRHEFAADNIHKGSSATREPGSVLWGKENDSSIMNYFPDLKQYVVQDQDRRELREFYACTEKGHEGLEFKDFEPGLFDFPISGGVVGVVSNASMTAIL